MQVFRDETTWHTCFVARALVTAKTTAMNLFYDPSIFALRQLVDTTTQKETEHNIAVDYDGEVIVDPEKQYPQVDLNRYKFHTRVKFDSDSKLRDLFRELVAIFNASNAIVQNKFNRAA